MASSGPPSHDNIHACCTSTFLRLLCCIAAAAVGAQAQSPAYNQIVVQVLRNYGYSILSTAIQLSNAQLLLPANRPGYTLFAPSDLALSSIDLPSDFFLPLLRYHIVSARRLPSQELSSLPLGTRLDTLLVGYSVVVTSINDSFRPFTIDDVPLADPDVYMDTMLAIHGINHIFDPRAFGLGGGLPGVESAPPPGPHVETPLLLPSSPPIPVAPPNIPLPPLSGLPPIAGFSPPTDQSSVFPPPLRPPFTDRNPLPYPSVTVPSLPPWPFPLRPNREGFPALEPPGV